MVMRYDRFQVKAVKTDEGYLKDTPVLTRVGVFAYRKPDGSIYKELRPADEVFHADSLASLAAIPITNGHHGKINAKTVKQHGIGTVLSAGRQDGDNLIADVVVHLPDVVFAGNKELSCGYECDLDETAGVFNGERYDAVQRNIRYNHLAVVNRGRAGNARFNMDAADAAFFVSDDERDEMSKLRLDSGIEYDAAPEVAHAYAKLKQDLADLTAEKDKQEARADLAENKIAEFDKQLTQIKQDALNEARARLALEATAKAHGVEVREDMAQRDVQIAVVQKLRQDVDFTGKSDDYVNAAFDLALADAAKNSVGKQREDMADKPAMPSAVGGLSAKQARENMLKGVTND